MPDQPREQHTIVEARQAAVQRCFGPNLLIIIQGAAACLECLQTPLLLQGLEVDLLVPDPDIPHRIDPAHGHDLDVGAFLGDMSVLGGVIFADNEVGDVGGQVVLVDAAELFCIACYCGLRGGKSRHGQFGSVLRSQQGHKHWAPGLTRRSVGILVQQTTTPVNGWEWSKASSP